MKVKELRDLLKDKDIKLINDAFVEVYKALPKSKKEELDDAIILNLIDSVGISKDEFEVNKKIKDIKASKIINFFK